MKNIIIILLFFISGTALAQEKLSDERWNEFEAQKVAFFTKELDLSPEEAAVFWPLYNEMRKKVGAAEGEMRKKNQAIRSSKGLTEENYREAVNRMLENEQKIVSLQKEYYQKMLQHLPASKIWKLRQAEHKFHRQLFDKLRRESCPKK